jgi:hypothetical protein
MEPEIPLTCSQEPSSCLSWTHTHPIHILPPYFFNMSMNIKLPSTPSSSKRFFLLGLPPNSCVHISPLLSYASHTPHLSYLFFDLQFLRCSSVVFKYSNAVSWLRPRPLTMKDQDLYQPSPARVGCVVYKFTLGQVYLWVLRFPHVNIIPPMLHTHSFFSHWSYILSAFERFVK